uniref:Phosphatidylinositol transfer protein alpha isoform n=1 Tax=Bos mutus grunniens TaxID=30521 RepID=A0A8B9YC76_BOSMU
MSGDHKGGGDKAGHREVAQAVQLSHDCHCWEDHWELSRQSVALHLGRNIILLKEYGVILPMSVKEYQVGQLYSMAGASGNEMGGGENMKVLTKKTYKKNSEKGHYTHTHTHTHTDTHKVYHLQSKLSMFFQMLVQEGTLNIFEKAWHDNSYCQGLLSPNMEARIYKSERYSILLCIQTGYCKVQVGEGGACRIKWKKLNKKQ